MTRNKDFTYAGLLSLLERVVSEHDPSLLDDQSPTDPMRAARADTARKQSLVKQVMAHHGPGLLLSAGQRLDLADRTPALIVLLRSATPEILAEKFMRLERYHHSAHRTAIETRDNSWHCRRSSRGSPASDGENCLIAGLLLGFAIEIGGEDCQLEIGGRLLRPGEVRTAPLAPGSATAQFRISWSSSRTLPPQQALPDEHASGRLSDRLGALFGTDIGRSWRSADAARTLALSERSMQRRLLAEARSFSSVLRQARMKEATVFLAETDTSLAEIGYCCGYADQAHFQRDFLRTANVTPRVFRRINRETDEAVRNR